MRPLFRPTTLAITALAVLVVACDDDVTDPDALLESAEAEAVLRSAASLPALPVVIDRAGDPRAPHDRTALYRAQELWAAGVAAGDPRGAARLRVAVRYAAPVLAETLPAREWDEVRRGLLDWIGTADAMLRHLALPEVERRIELARAHLRRADAAPDADSRARALLLAGAELNATTPRAVARTLAARADAAVRAAGRNARDPEDPALRRARRLSAWAARAVAEGDDLLAIQRAYYAIQLVEGR